MIKRHAFPPVRVQRAIRPGLLFLVGAVLALGSGQAWVRAAAVNVFFVDVVQRGGLRNSNLGVLANAAPLTPQRRAWLLGVQALTQGDYEQAIRILETGLQDDPDHIMLRGFLGQAYYEAGDYPRALSNWERVGAAEFLYVAGNTLEMTGRCSEAVQFLEGSVQVTPPGHPHAHFLLAYCYLHLGSAERALAAAQTAARLDRGRNTGYRLVLAQAYEKAGYVDRARQEYLTILNMDSDSDNSRAARDGLLRIEETLKEKK
jgi:tetratricopeptide (TPR) repeat protein